jgi:hypothetical protein
MGFAATRSEGPPATATMPLFRGQVGRLLTDRQVVIGAATVTGATTLLTPWPAWRRRGRDRHGRRLVGGRVVGPGVGGMMAFATAAVEALFEQADFGFEVGDALQEFVLVALLTGCQGGLVLGELCFELGLAPEGALVEGFVVADLLASIAEKLLAGGQAAGCLAGEGGTGDKVVRFHTGSMPTASA